MKKTLILIGLITLFLITFVSASLSYGKINHWNLNLKFDEVAFYDKVYSEAEIREIYAILYSEQLCLRNDLYILIEENETSGIWNVYDNIC